jgi:large subunit ribosomal protein L7/L12
VSTIGDEALLEYIRGINERLRRLEDHAERVAQQLGVPFGDPSGLGSGSAAGSASAGSGVPPEVVALAQGGKKIEAIKRYRELTGVGLREAKDVVDGI